MFGVPRTVMVLAVLLTETTGVIGDALDPHDLVDQVVDLLRLGVRHVEGPDDLIFVLLALLGGVLDDQDGAFVQHLVPELIGGHDQVQPCSSVTPDDVERRRPLDDRLRALLDDDVDAGDVADELQDVLDRRCWSRNGAQRRLRCRVEDRRLRSGGGPARASRRCVAGARARRRPSRAAAVRARRAADGVRVAGRELERPCGTRPARPRARPSHRDSRALSRWAFDAACIARSSAIL